VWKKVHAAIQANPDRVKKAAAKPNRKVVAKAPQLVQQNGLAKSRNGGKWLREKKVPSAVKKAKLDKIVAAINKRYGKKK
jgi:hypothetical protein